MHRHDNDVPKLPDIGFAHGFAQFPDFAPIQRVGYENSVRLAREISSVHVLAKSGAVQCRDQSNQHIVFVMYLITMRM
jgi:hypothetical protein